MSQREQMRAVAAGVGLSLSEYLRRLGLGLPLDLAPPPPPKSRKLAVTFDSADYRSNHGAEPRGWGTWAFAVVGSEDGITFLPPMTYAHAKRAFAAQLAREGATGAIVVTVCS